VLRCEGGWYGTAEPKYEAPKNYRFAKRMPNGQLRVVFKGWYPPSCLQRAEVGSVAKATRVQVTKFIFISPSLFSCLSNFVRTWLILVGLTTQICTLTHTSVSSRLYFNCSFSLGNINSTISRGHTLVSISRASFSGTEVQVMFACLNNNVKKRSK
jgi:hypothetical protein